MHKGLILFAACLAGPMLPGCSGQDQNFQRGLDWMSLNQFENARSDFEKVIRHEPKHIEARYQIAMSYYKQGYLQGALVSCGEIMEISHGRDAKATQLIDDIRRDSYRLLNNADVHHQLEALDVLESVANGDSVQVLQSALKSPDLLVVGKSETILAKLGPNRVRDGWAVLLMDSTPSLQQRAAERLWTLYRDDRAKPILKKAFSDSFFGKGYASLPEKRPGESLLDLGYEYTKDVFERGICSFRNDNSYVVVFSISAIASAKDKTQIPLLMETLGKIRADISECEACRAIVKALAELDAKEAVPLLKQVLSVHLKVRPNFSTDILLSTLAKLDDPLWSTFPYWRNDCGNDEFRHVVYRVESFFQLGRGNVDRGVDPIFRGGPNEAKVLAFMDTLSHGNLRSRDLVLSVNEISVRSHHEVDIVVDLELNPGNRSTPVGTVTFAVRRTGNPASAWAVWDVQYSVPESSSTPMPQAQAGETEDSHTTSSAPKGTTPGEPRRSTIRIATFQLGRFDETKLSNRRVSDVLVRLLPQFDLIAMQGIRGKDQGVLIRLVELINAASGRTYDFATCPIQQRNTVEHYGAFLFDRSRIDVDRTTVHLLEDRLGRFHTKPLLGSFRAHGPEPAEAFTFTLINAETDPDHVATELDLLAEAFRDVHNDARGEDDIILLGDIKCDDQHMGQLGKLPGLTALPSNIPTTIRGTTLMENILLDHRTTSEFTGRVGVVDMVKDFKLTTQEAQEVSENLPVWAEFSMYEGGHPANAK